MADAPRFCVSEPLCYIAAKFGKHAAKTLKSILYDFYSLEALMSARDVLSKLGEELSVDKWPRPSRRRKDSTGNRLESADVMLRAEIDSLMAIWSFVDENKLSARLPVFVAVNPDNLPSAKLGEGDLQAIMNKLNKLDRQMLELDNNMDNCTKAVSSLNFVTRPSAGPGRGAVGGRGVGRGGGPGGSGGGRGTTGGGLGVVALPANIEGSLSQPPPGAVRWGDRASVSEDPMESNSSAQEDDGNGPWEVQQSSKKRKLVKGASPSPPTYAIVANSVPQGQAAPIESAPAAKKVMIGHSTTAVLKASKNLWVKKSVYCLGNIDANYTTENVQEFIESLGVRVATCNVLKPVKNQPSDNNRYRIAIFSEDNDKLLNALNWSAGISIRKWVFKPKDAASSFVHNEMNVDETESTCNTNQQT